MVDDKKHKIFLISVSCDEFELFLQAFRERIRELEEQNKLYLLRVRDLENRLCADIKPEAYDFKKS